MISRMVSKARSLLSSLRRSTLQLIRGSLHPWRRRRARSRLRNQPVPERVLFLCLGNICRSPYAEAYLRKEGSGLELEVESGGFIGPGRPPPDEALTVASQRDVDTGGHVSRLVTREAADAADLIVLMDPRHARLLRREAGSVKTPVLVLGDLDPASVRSRTIPDPWGQSPEVFRDVFRRVERCVDELLMDWRDRSHG